MPQIQIDGITFNGMQFSPPPLPGQKALFGFGNTGPIYNMTNLVSNTGVVSTDTPGVGTARYGLAAATYGTDKAIFGYGAIATVPYVTNITNLVSNTGVVASDQAAVTGTARQILTAAGYGTDKAIFGFGNAAPASSNITNLVSNTGVVAGDVSGVGTARQYLAGTSYGTDKAIFGYGQSPVVAPASYSITNLISNTGVVASDTPGIGTTRNSLAAATYGVDKAIFGYGGGYVAPAAVLYSITNLVSNTGVVATDTPGVGTGRQLLAAAGYGGDKAIFGYGVAPGVVSMTNLVSNTGVVAGDVTGVGTARGYLAASSFS